MERGGHDFCGPDDVPDAPKSVAKKDPSTYEPWMGALMSAVGQHCDWMDRKYLEPLLQYIGMQE